MMRGAAIRCAGALALAASFGVHEARAFPGFFAGGTDARATNNATQIVVMREKQRTVVSVMPDYQGPVGPFALLLPVPASVTKDDIKTMGRTSFERIELLDSPRLVEYWEMDPCSPMAATAGDAGSGVNVTRGFGGSQGPTVQPHFSVAEYDVMLLTPKESASIATWLKANKLYAPPNLEAQLKPYLDAGMKLLVAKIDGKKLQFINGIAQFSPIRVAYDSERFVLPMRLGLVSSPGVQEVIVHVLARHQRYEVANYANVFAPTNIDVGDGAKALPAAMYTTVFDALVARSPRSFVTEYAWSAKSCDPCTTPPLTADELLTFGADQLPSAPGEINSPTFGAGFVLSRMHARYKPEELTEDLVLRAADPIAGGREERKGGALDHGTHPAPENAFQARFAVRHEWTGPVKCESPKRGVWGPSPQGMKSPTQGALRLPYALRAGMKLSSFLREDVPELGFTVAPPEPANAGAPPTPSAKADAPAPKKSGCSGCTTSGATDASALAVLLPLAALARRRRR
jgi:MYXO-CTERM domain-containing protein